MVNARRIILLAVLALLLFLGLYTWNQRTGRLDVLGANTGLEAAGVVTRAFHSARSVMVGLWERYVALVDVREQNDELTREVQKLTRELALAREESAELARLREYLYLDYPCEWPAVGARVLAWRVGPNASLETIMLSRGYLTGATPGTPLVSYEGLAGRVFKAGPSTSLALLITDPGSRVAVVSSRSRVQGIVAGGGPGAPLDMRFVRHNSPLAVGEILLTSGMDSAYPKGVPVARVTSVSPGAMSMDVLAEPLVAFDRLEEVLLLERPVGWFAPDAPPVYTRRPERIESDMQPFRSGMDPAGSVSPAAGRP